MKNSVTVLLIAGIVILLNVLSRQFFLRLDLTQGKQYTLSKATKDILSNLDDQVTIKAYFSEDLPPDIAATRRDFQDMLVEYATRSKGDVDYEFINPNADPMVEQELAQLGIGPVVINVREKDQVKQQRAYLSAVIQMGEEQEVIPFVQPGGAMEYELTTNIKKLSVADKPSVGILQGHGEPAIQELAQAYQSLSVLYEVEPIDLNQVADIESRFRAVAMIGPSDTLRQDALAKLDRYLDQGGNLLLAFDRVNGDLSQAQGTAVDFGLVSWLRDKGILVDDSFITDSRSGSVSVRQQSGFMTFNTQVAFPYLPLIQGFDDHPVTKGLESVIFEFASPIRFEGDSSRVFTPLVTSSAKSGSVKAPLYFDINKEWTEHDFPQSNLVIGGVLEQNAGLSGSRLVVFSDGSFPVSGQGQQNADNVNLMVNTMDWLSDDTGLIDLRTKGVTARPIEDMEDSERSFIKYANFAMPIILILIYGFVRGQRNKSKRMRRMQEKWV